MEYRTLFFLKIKKDVAKCVVCCSCDWRFKSKSPMIGPRQAKKFECKILNIFLSICFNTCILGQKRNAAYNTYIVYGGLSPISREGCVTV